MFTTRRAVLTGLAAMGSTFAAPAWAQAIGRQSDPWAQVDPYADPRNGFPSQAPVSPQPPGHPRDAVFSSAADPGDGLSEEDEVALGRAYYPRLIAEEGGTHPDGRLQAALKEFCRPLFAVSDRPHLPWEVTLVDSREINASAFAGGKVIVNTGLLPHCDQPGELAAILGHEIGHVDKRHTVRGVQGRELFAYLRQGGGAEGGQSLDILLPNSHGQVKDIWDLFAKGFSREDEAEADAHEMVIIERLGVDPRHALNNKLAFLKLSAGGELNELASTHPSDESRLEHIRQLAAMQRRPKQDYVFPGWPVLKAAFPTDPRFKKA